MFQFKSKITIFLTYAILCLMVAAIAAPEKSARALYGHSFRVTSIAFSPDGRTLITGNWDKTVKIWNLQTGKLLHTLKHDALVWGVAFSPDGKKIASVSGVSSRNGSIAGQAKIWDVKTGKLISTLPSQRSRVAATFLSVTFSPNGKSLVIGSGDTAIRWWNLQSGKVERTLWHRDYVEALVFSPDGKMLASGGGGVKLWDAHTGKLLYQIASSYRRVPSFSPDNRVVTTHSGKGVQLWDTKSGKLLRNLAADNQSSTGIAQYSPNGETLAAVSNYGRMMLWDTKTWKVKRRMQGDCYDVSSLMFSPNGNLIAVGGGTIRDVEVMERRPGVVLLWKTPN